ncbi:MAG: hypothetical protein JNJ49_17435 [Bdellovibrionaceae bacterium]|nr:hypothetical protein [Pseudobdellovibrionaceae bacterium]
MASIISLIEMLVKTHATTEFQKALMQSPKWPDVELVCAHLRTAGYQAVVAGGAVRDAWLGLSPNEFDVATSATPDQIEAVFRGLAQKTIGVGKSFGVIVVLADSGPIEVATFRADGAYTDGRHPDSIVFSNLEHDAERRDFTINAMFYDPATKELIDVVDGIRDLQSRVIRAVGEPAKRFQEDALRVMRAVRFTAQLGFELEPATERAVHAAAGTLTKVSRERLTVEFDKLLIGRYAEEGLRCFQRLELDRVVFPLWSPILFPLTTSLTGFSLEERRLHFFWPLLQSGEVAESTFELTLKEYRYGRDFILLLQWLRRELQCFDGGLVESSRPLLPASEVDRLWAKHELKSTTLDRRLLAQLLVLVDPRSRRVLRVLENRLEIPGLLIGAEELLNRRGLSLGQAPKIPGAAEVRALRGPLEGAPLGAAIQDLYRERLLRAKF